MPRRTYETKSDLKNESVIAKEIADRWHVDLGKLPSAYRIDFIAFNELGTKAFIEVKSRNINIGQYEKIMLSLGKWQAGIALANSVHVKFIFVVGTNNGIYYYTYDPNHAISVEFGGRTTNTRDFADIEPVVMIPSSYFKPL